MDVIVLQGDDARRVGSQLLIRRYSGEEAGQAALGEQRHGDFDAEVCLEGRDTLVLRKPFR